MQTIVDLPAPGKDGEDLAAMHRSRRSFVRFLCFLLIPPLLIYLAAFPLVRTASFEQWCPSQWGPMLEWAFDAKHQDADVVIFGDSSAFLGIDPRIVDAELGTKSVVLPNTIGSLPVTGDLALREYLKNNRRPKIIVFYFSAWNLDYLHAQSVRLFEGEEMMLRHSSWPMIRSYWVHHPLEMLAFPLRLYSTFGLSMLKDAMRPTHRERSTALALGHVDDHDPFAALAQPCTLPAKYFGNDSDASVRALTERFASRGTRVVVYLAPIPRCRNSDSLIRETAARFGEAPAQLQPDDFVGDGYYAHLRPAAVPAASRLLAQALESNMSSAK